MRFEEILRRFFRKQIEECKEIDIKFLGCNSELSLGQKCGIGYAIHSMWYAYDVLENRAVLLIAAKITLNSLNRHWFLKILFKFSYFELCQKSYTVPSDQFVAGNCLHSRDGTALTRDGTPIAVAV